MKPYFMYFFLLCVVLVEATLLPITLVLAVLLSWSSIYSEREAIWAAIIGGLILDIVAFQPWGSHSIIFVIFLLGFSIVRRIRIVMQNRRLRLLYYAVAVILQTSLVSIFALHIVVWQPHWFAWIGSFLAIVVTENMFELFVGPKEKEPIRLKL